MTLANSSTQNTVGEMLHDAGIKKVALIDDAFDVPSVKSLYGDEIGDFWNIIERDDEARDELQNLGLDISDSSDINDNTLATLWEHRDDLKELRRPVVGILFARKLQDYNELESLYEHLSGVGLEIYRLGEDDDMPEPSTNIVFIDYFLGVPSDPQSVTQSSQIAREIYQAADVDEKPFIVLMSSDENVSGMASKFRDDSGLLGGLFDFVSKADLIAKEKLNIRLRIWAAGMPTRHKFQRFVETLQKSLPSKTNEFIKKIRSLGFEDYAYVQRLSLQEDGHPLGDYMLWLYGSLLSHILLEDNEEIRMERKALDQLAFEQFLPSQRPPSVQLAEIYRMAISEPMYEEISVHPRTDDSDESASKLPMLHLGDLLIKDVDSEVYMVATPDCDLAFAPGTKREPDSSRSVFLVPGTLKLIHESSRGSSLRTELFEYEGISFRILWDPKHVIVKRLDEFMEWYENGEYSRPARLRLPYALQIQQSFAANLTRVGMPVPPPFFEFVDVEVYCSGEDDRWEKLCDSVSTGATIVHDRTGLQFFLTGECIELLQDQLDSVLQRHQARLKDSPGSNANSITRKIEALQACDSSMLFASIRKTWPLPDLGKRKELISKVLALYRGGDLEGKSVGNLNFSIGLNLEYGEHLDSNGDQQD